MEQADALLVSVIIVNYNTASMVFTSLSSLYDHVSDLPIEVIVVDNASSDHSVSLIHRHFPDVAVIENSANLGFGVANNQGIARARGRYVLFLNSDTLVLPGAIQCLVEALEHHPDVALVGPTVLGYDGVRQRSAFRFPKPLSLLLDELSLSKYLPVVPQPNEQACTSDTFAVDWLLGACILGRREQMLEYGPFDARFFMYAEDIDLAYRLRGDGWDIRLVPAASIMHWGGYTSRLDRIRMAVRSTESMYLFYRLHYTDGELLLALLIFRAAAGVRLVWDMIHWMRLALATQQSDTRYHLLENLIIWRRVLRLQPPVVAAAPRKRSKVRHAT